jgi:transcriptional accessory protein Tex/SPT6
MSPSHLLLLDDDPAYCLQLQEEAKAYRFDIHYHHNLEDGLDALLASRRYKAVILDGRCFIEPGQQGTARSNFVYHALQRIADIENEYNRTIPFCINSEHPDDFREDLEGIAHVFRKTIQHEALFEWLKDTIYLLPETTIRKQYYDIFEKIAPHFSEEEEDLLIDVLQGSGTSDRALIITNLALLRRLLERLIDIACVTKLNKQPEAFLSGSGSRTRLILDALNNRVLPPELFVTANQLYKTCSKYGNHKSLQNKALPQLNINKYFSQRLVHTFLELADYLLE